MKRAYKFRAYCNVGTRKRALRMMYGPLADVWNKALKQRQDTYAKSKKDEAVKAVSSYKDPREYAIIKGRDAFPGVHKWVLQDVLVKLDGSFRSFFDLCKKDPLARPPKEKKAHRCIVYRMDTKGKLGGADWDGNVLTCKGLGRFKVRLHRPIEGRIKTVSITQSRRGFWYISFSCDLPDVPEKPVVKETDLCFGNGVFLTDTSGRVVEYPEFYYGHIAELRRLSRALSRKTKGSKNRRKARRTLAKFHEHIANKRKDFLWNLAKEYAENYDQISIPKLPMKLKIQYATDSRTAIRFIDASYSMFATMLKNKCTENGSLIRERNDEWELQIQQLTEQARLQAIQRLYRATASSLRKQNHKALKSLLVGYEQAATLQICSPA